MVRVRIRVRVRVRLGLGLGLGLGSLEADFDDIFGPSKIGHLTEIPGVWENGWYIWTGLWKANLMKFSDPRK